MLNGCTPLCRSSACGDGVLDVNGPDGISGTVDDEECDDGNNIDGDGCSAACAIEYCGDGIVNQPEEECDLGINNGVYGGLCSSTCQNPNDECVSCWEVCYGGTGAHSIYLLVDRSGSMNGFNRLGEWQDAAIEFIGLTPHREFDGSGNWTSGSKV